LRKKRGWGKDKNKREVREGGRDGGGTDLSVFVCVVAGKGVDGENERSGAGKRRGNLGSGGLKRRGRDAGRTCYPALGKDRGDE